MNKYEFMDFIFESSLSPASRFVALAIMNYHRQGSDTFPSKRTLMFNTGYNSHNTIDEAIRELVDAGIIKVVKKRFGKSTVNSYLLIGLDFDESVHKSNNDKSNNDKSKSDVSNDVSVDVSVDVSNIDPEYMLIHGNTCKGKNHSSLRSECQKETGCRFKKPTLDEVRSYCAERQNGVDPEKWFDYYTSNGWKVGKNPMKDWKAAVRIWEKEEQRKPVESVSCGAHRYTDAEIKAWLNDGRVA